MAALSAVLAAVGVRAGTADAARAGVVTQLCGNPAPDQRIPVRHVIVIMLENYSYSQVVGDLKRPFQTHLATTCGVATHMYAATHTSAANYFAVSAGQFPPRSVGGCETNKSKGCLSDGPSIYGQLDAAGLSWMAYEESMPARCYGASARPYKVGHNPAVFYSALSDCKADDVPNVDLTRRAGAFWSDLQHRTLPSFAWVTPNLNHSEGLAIDGFLSKLVNLIGSSRSYLAGDTAVLITYDEGGLVFKDQHPGQDCTDKAADLAGRQESCHIPFFVVYPFTPGGPVDTFFDHYSVTKTVEDVFGLPYLAHAGDATTTSLVGSFGLRAPARKR